MELVFQVTQDADGGYCAECLSEDIFTQAESWDELRGNVREAIEAYYFDADTKPEAFRLNLTINEVVSVA